MALWTIPQAAVAIPPTGFDAIVDASFTRDPTTGKFTDIGDALETLRLAGRTNVTVGVKSSQVGGTQKYTETTSMAGALVRTHIIGLGTGTISSGGQVIWDTNGKTLALGQLRIENMTIQSGVANAATDLFNSTSVALFGINCTFQATPQADRIVRNGGQMYLLNCYLNSISPGVSEFHMVGGHWDTPGGIFNVRDNTALGTQHWVLDGVQFGGSNGTTLNWGSGLGAPNQGILTLSGCVFDGDGGLVGGASGSFINTYGSNMRVLVVGNTNKHGNQVSHDFTNCVESAFFGLLTGTLTKGGTAPFTMDATGGTDGVSSPNLDVTGPASIKYQVTSNQSTPIKLRGANVAADISLRFTNLVTAGAVGVQGIGLTDSRLDISAKYAGGAAGQTAYVEDGASARNIVDVAGNSGWPVTSTFQASTISRVT